DLFTCRQRAASSAPGRAPGIPIMVPREVPGTLDRTDDGPQPVEQRRPRRLAACDTGFPGRASAPHLDGRPIGQRHRIVENDVPVLEMAAETHGDMIVAWRLGGGDWSPPLRRCFGPST